MEEARLNIPIERLREARNDKRQFRALAAAITIKERFQNSTVYCGDNPTKALMRVLRCSFYVAKELQDDLVDFGYCVFLKDKNGIKLFAKGLRSRNRQSFHGYKATERDFVYKLRPGKPHSLKEMRKLLREILLMNEINACQCLTASTGRNTQNRRDRVDGSVIIPQRELANVSGLSKSSVSKYVRRMDSDKRVRKTRIVAELVVPVLNDDTKRQWNESHPNIPLHTFHDDEHGQWIGCVLLGCGYGLNEESRNFYHLLWRHKKYLSSKIPKQKKEGKNYLDLTNDVDGGWYERRA